MVTIPRLMRELANGSDRNEAQSIPKHVWMDLYADLYRQTHGEQSGAPVILQDAHDRIRTLKANGLL